MSTSATFATTAVSVTSTATLLLASRTARESAVVFNNGSVTVYIGASGVTAATGLPVAPGQPWPLDNVMSAVYGITSSGTADVRVGEAY